MTRKYLRFVGYFSSVANDVYIFMYSKLFVCISTVMTFRRTVSECVCTKQVNVYCLAHGRRVRDINTTSLTPKPSPSCSVADIGTLDSRCLQSNPRLPDCHKAQCQKTSQCFYYRTSMFRSEHTLKRRARRLQENKTTFLKTTFCARPHNGNHRRKTTTPGTLNLLPPWRCLDSTLVENVPPPTNITRKSPK